MHSRGRHLPPRERPPSPSVARPATPVHVPARLGRGVALLAAVLLTLAALIATLATTSAHAWRDVLAPGPAELDDLVMALTGPLALTLAAWLLIAIVTATTDALLSRSRRRSSARLGRSANWSTGAAWYQSPASAATPSARWAHAIAPSILRHGVAALLGVVLVSAPVNAVADSASPPAADASHSHQTWELAPGWPPVQARAGAVIELSSPGPSEVKPAGRPAADQRQSLPGWLPDPSGPVAVKAETWPGPSNLNGISGTTRRRLDDDRLVVRRGDTLWTIAARSLGASASDAQIAAEWPRWFTANRDVIGSDPDRLLPGQRLRPPAQSSHLGGSR